MKSIGITAGIGAGKSEVLRYLKNKYGAIIVEADKIGHEVMERIDVIGIIVDIFGNEILNDGKINRLKLSKICFEDKKKLDKLSEVLHPIIKQEILLNMKKAELDNERLFVLEAALLIEAGYKEFLDNVWYIYCPKEIRIERLMKNRGLSYKQCLDIIDKQLSDNEFMKECDVIIENLDNLETLYKNIDMNLTLDNG